MGVGSSEARENRGGNAGTGGTGGTGDRGEVGDMGMREADGSGCAVESAPCEFVFGPPTGNAFFSPLGLFPKPNRAPSERMEGRPLFPMLPCESPERVVDAVLGGEGDFFLPAEPAAGESRG